jgi:glycosyltransferase involved in cell wall biosynthesis
MKVVFDCRYTRIGQHDGISRYTAGLVGALAAKHSVIMLINDRRQLANLPDLPWELVSGPTSIREPLVALQVNRLNPDVVFSPMQTMGSFGRRYRLVLTVHDLIYYSNPTPPPSFAWPVRLLWRLYHLSWWPQRFLLNKADAIVTVSETTRDLIALHNLTRHPVTVVRNAAGAPPVDDEGVLAAGEPRTRSLVYMGSFMPYKNVEALVRAAGLLPDYDLHLMSRISDRERSLLEGIAPGARLVFHNGATDEEYRQVLSRATALVTASRAEGFGIPLVEAMSQATPIVVSDIPVFREIGGEAGLYFDSEDPAQLAERIRQLEDPATFQDHARLSVAQAALFSWERSSETLWELLAEEGSRRSRR